MSERYESIDAENCPINIRSDDFGYCLVLGNPDATALAIEAERMDQLVNLARTILRMTEDYEGNSVASDDTMHTYRLDEDEYVYVLARGPVSVFYQANNDERVELYERPSEDYKDEVKPYVRNEQMLMVCKYCKEIIEPFGDMWVALKSDFCKRSVNKQHAPDICEPRDYAREATSQ